MTLTFIDHKSVHFLTLTFIDFLGENVEDFSKNLFRWKEKNKSLLIDLMDKKLKEINLKNPRISQKMKQSPIEEWSKLLQRWQAVRNSFWRESNG